MSKSQMKRLAIQKGSVRITAKCVGCGWTHDYAPGDIPRGEHPACAQCFMPMVPTGVEAKAALK